LNSPIYQRLNGSRPFALVMNRRQRFTKRLRAAIQSTEGLGIYTDRRFLSDYEDYLESRLGIFLSNESVPLETRSEVLYGQASKAVEGLFTGDISPKSLEKAANEATHLSMYLSLNPKVLRSMMSMTSNDITPSPIPSMSASTAWDCISMSFLGKARPRWVRFLSDCCFTTSESPG